MNPMRAKMAESLQESEFTSAMDRVTGKRGRAMEEKMQDSMLKIQAEKRMEMRNKRGRRQMITITRAREEAQADAWLCPMGEVAGRHTLLDMSLDGYLSLVKWTGQALRADKRGALPEGMRPLLDQVDLNVAAWVETVMEFGRIYHRVAGKEQSLRENAGVYG